MFILFTKEILQVTIISFMVLPFIQVFDLHLYISVSDSIYSGPVFPTSNTKQFFVFLLVYAMFIS